MFPSPAPNDVVHRVSRQREVAGDVSRPFPIHGAMPDFPHQWLGKFAQVAPLATGTGFGVRAGTAPVAPGRAAFSFPVRDVVRVGAEPEVCGVDARSVVAAGAVVQNQHAFGYGAAVQLPRHAVRPQTFAAVADFTVPVRAFTGFPEPAAVGLFDGLPELVFERSRLRRPRTRPTAIKAKRPPRGGERTAATFTILGRALRFAGHLEASLRGVRGPGSSRCRGPQIIGVRTPMQFGSGRTCFWK